MDASPISTVALATPGELVSAVAPNAARATRAPSAAKTEAVFQALSQLQVMVGGFNGLPDEQQRELRELKGRVLERLAPLVQLSQLLDSVPDEADAEQLRAILSQLEMSEHSDPPAESADHQAEPSEDPLVTRWLEEAEIVEDYDPITHPRLKPSTAQEQEAQQRAEQLSKLAVDGLRTHVVGDSSSPTTLQQFAGVGVDAMQVLLKQALLPYTSIWVSDAHLPETVQRRATVLTTFIDKFLKDYVIGEEEQPSDLQRVSQLGADILRHFMHHWMIDVVKDSPQELSPPNQRLLCAAIRAAGAYLSTKLAQQEPIGAGADHLSEFSSLLNELLCLYLPGEDYAELRRNLQPLIPKLYEALFNTILSPQFILKVILRIRLPDYIGMEPTPLDAAQPSNEWELLLVRQPEQCFELGDALVTSIHSALQLSRTDRQPKWYEHVVKFLLTDTTKRKFGALVYQEINEGLRGERSAILDMVKGALWDEHGRPGLLESAGHTVDSATLQQQIAGRIQTDFAGFIKMIVRTALKDSGIPSVFLPFEAIDSFLQRRFNILAPRLAEIASSRQEVDNLIFHHLLIAARPFLITS